jgi:hypothetical protein
MATTSLNDPIDGAELKAIILERISRALDKDCTLANDVAYAGFSLGFEINIKFLRSKTIPTLIWGGAQEGVAAVGDDVVKETLTDTYATDSPNTAREAHSLPVPVMVQTPTGPQRRKLHVNPRQGAAK